MVAQTMLPGLDTEPNPTTTWRKIKNLTITRTQHPHGTTYRATTQDGTVIARFNDSTPGGGTIGGHIDHTYAWVQGEDAPCRTVTAWLAALHDRPRATWHTWTPPT